MLQLRNLKKAAAIGIASLFTLAAAPFGGAQDYDDEEQYTIPAAPAIVKHPTLSSSSKEDVGARLVCLFDISGSVDMTEYDIQIEAMAKAIESDDFRTAVFHRGGPQSIAICIVDFGNTPTMRIPWIDIRKGEDHKFKALADEVRLLARREVGSTHQVQALDYSMRCFDICPWKGKRNIVDIITDGQDNEFPSPEARLKISIDKLATSYEATVNALITIDPMYPQLDKWAPLHLITPPTYTTADGKPLRAGFVKVVANQNVDKGAIVKYQRAMEMAFRRKLILEVAGLEIEELRKLVNAEAPPPPLIPALERN